MNTINVVSPLTGQLLGEYPISSIHDINDKLAKARIAQANWQALSVKQRAEQIGRLRQIVLARLDEITAVINNVSGKVKTDALLGEIYPIIHALAFYQRHAGRILADIPVPSSPYSYPHAYAKIHYRPFGIVAVIAPANYPFQLSLLPILTALIAGNAVILKPSEFSAPIAELITDLFQRISLPADLVSVVQGDKTTALALIDAKPDLVFFTGGVAAGREVMARAAQHPIPVLLELGGKDPLLVFDDAPLTRTVSAAVYGAFCSSGQVCVSIERAYVQRSLYPAFIEAACAATKALRVGPDDDLGAMVSEQQIARVEAHYRDALARGAQASGPLRRDGHYLHPVVLWDVNHDMQLMREESFGPLLPLMPFDNEADAVRLANDSPFGLNASVFSADVARAERVAKQLQVGNWAVNDVIKHIGHPYLPFGGTKQSGFGRYHGAEGLRSFSQTVSGLVNDGSTPQEPNWFPYSAERYEAFKGYLDFILGDGPLWLRGKRNTQALQAFRNYASLNIRQHFNNIKLSLPWFSRTYD